MSMEKRQPLRQVLTDILIQHQCMSDSGCSCGHVPVGASYADHVAGTLLPAIEEHIAAENVRQLDEERVEQSEIREGDQLYFDDEDQWVTVESISKKEDGSFRLWIVNDKLPTNLNVGDTFPIRRKP